MQFKFMAHCTILVISEQIVRDNKTKISSHRAFNINLWPVYILAKFVWSEWITTDQNLVMFCLLDFKSHTLIYKQQWNAVCTLWTVLYTVLCTDNLNTIWRVVFLNANDVYNLDALIHLANIIFQCKTNFRFMQVLP